MPQECYCFKYAFTIYFCSKCPSNKCPPPFSAPKLLLKWQNITADCTPGSKFDS